MDKSKKSIAPPVTSQVETPSATPAGGQFAQAQTVGLTCATAGAEIYYTVDGTSTSQNKTRYTVPIQISTTTTLKAKAYKSGMTVSNEISETYTIT